MDIVPLSRTGEVRSWTLSEALPDVAMDADCILHLACAAIGANADDVEAAELDLTGTQRLIDDITQKGSRRAAPRLVFVSSQSASPQARNAYGRSKWAVEQRVVAARQTIVRPGLVYGDRSEGVAGLFEKLSAMPAVPNVETAAAIQPIHVEELADCLLRIALNKVPASLYRLGSVRALTFREAVEASARRRRRSPPIFLPMPVDAVRWGARALDRLKRSRLSFTERIEGLLALEPMETASSLERLGIALSPFDRPKQQPDPA